MDRLRIPGGNRITRALRYLSAAACALSAFQCLEQPLEPVAPSWDLPLTLPLANRTHSLSEIVSRDTSMLRAGAGGIVEYRAHMQAPATPIGDLLSFRPPDTTAVIRLGTFAVATPPMTMPLVVPWLPPGATVPVPDTTTVLPALPVDVPTFETVTFATGTITLTMTNHLPVEVDVPGTVTLTDNDGRTLARFTFPPGLVPPNGTASATDDLAGKTTGHELVMNGLLLHTPGSTTPVVIPPGDHLTLTLATSGTRARRASLAQIPPQRLADNDSADLALDDSTLVEEARFSSGRLHVDVTSHIALPLVFRFRIDDLYRTSGGRQVVYEDSIALQAGASGGTEIRLTGCTLRSSDGSLLRSLRTVTTVALQQGQSVTIADTDRVEVRLTTPEAPVIDSAVGVVRPTWLDVNVPVAVDFGELPTRFAGQINIPAASLGLSTAVSFGFPMDLYVVIGARTAANTWTYLSVPGTQKRIQPGAGSVTFDTSEVGGFLSAFSGELPDTLYLLGQVLVNPPEAYLPTLAGAGSFGRHSAFQGAITLDVPLMLGISDGTYRDTLAIGDTTGDGAGDFRVDRDRLHNVQSGRIYVDIDNGLPMAMTMQLQLLNGAAAPLLTLPRAGEQIGVPAAQVDAQGNVTVPAFRRSTIVLNTSDVRQFDPASALAYALFFATPPGGAARFRVSDYVHVRVWSTLSYRVNG
jgi:hypothetical protein